MNGRVDTLRSCIVKLRTSIQVLFLAALLLIFSGCASLLLLGAGAAGGYFIKKGEEESLKTKEPSLSIGYSSINKIG